MFMSRKQLLDSENVPAGSVWAIVQSNPLHFADEETEVQREKKTCPGSFCELVAKLRPEPRPVLGSQPISMSTSSTMLEKSTQNISVTSLG